jgi:hypothetical protein
MSRLILYFFLFTLSFYASAQKDSTALEKRGGFKDIKLGMIADSVKGAKVKKEFKEKDQFPAKLYSVDNPAYERIGEVKVIRVELKAYTGLIYEISVITEKDTRVMKALESIYGKSEYDMKNETYFWKNQNMTLKFSAHGKHHLELLYYSFNVLKMMKLDKNKKVDDIANDF